MEHRGNGVIHLTDLKTRVETDGLGDWRIAAASKLAKAIPAAYPGGPAHMAGAPVYLTTIVSTAQYPNFGFITPNAAALTLNASFRSAETASELFKQFSFRTVPTPSGPGTLLDSNCTPLLFDYLSFAMAAAASAFQSLEAFANEMIARHLHGSITLDRRSGPEALNSEDIQRFVSTEEKIGVVLPILFEKSSIKGTVSWEQFKLLKAVRDGATHFKSGHQYPLGGKVGADSLYALLLNNEPTRFPHIALDLIWRLRKTEWTPRWLAHLAERHGFDGNPS